MNLKNEMSKRNKIFYDKLINRSFEDRSTEWFKQDMLKDIAKEYPNDSVILRRAKAIDEMLKAMTNKSYSKNTLTAEIFPEDLLLGNLTMGSNGLGKVFPNYLNEDEKRAGAITNRGSLSLLGHNSLNYFDLVNKGLQAIIDDCIEKKSLFNVENEFEKPIMCNDLLLEEHHIRKNQHDFYESVQIACQSVIDYASRFADEAIQLSVKTKDPKRVIELQKMAEIARKVPRYKSDNFNEALQSIWFFHVALHASMNFISLGRLDQVLNPFLIKESSYDKALELFENFIIKAAWRINMNLEHSNIVKQDHVDNNTVLGANPYLIDQKAGVNNFLQNIIIGGLKPNGEDGTNECTYLILQAFSNVNLSTPGIYVRVHKKTPEKLLNQIALCWKKTSNNPAIINDEIMINAMKKALLQGENLKDKQKIIEIEKLANDFCVDGCWEPILNGKSDWTFAMTNALTALECALNEGGLLTNDPELLRGAKKAPRTKKPETYDEVMEMFSKQLGFFVDQCVISLFMYYMMDEYTCPSPLLSAYLDGCMEKGRDKAWGGTKYNLGGVILSGVPNVVNTLVAIRKWVYPKHGVGKYTLSDVCYAFANDFKYRDEIDSKKQDFFDTMRIDFSTNTPTFGSDDKLVTKITEEVLNSYYKEVMNSAKFAKKVYQDKPKTSEEAYIISLRSISGYYGLSLEEKFGEFNMKITAGLGTFEQYNWMGRGNSASADRLKSEPLAPNFSPVSGTATSGIGGMLSLLNNLELDRFAAGVITDTCLEVEDASVEHLTSLLKTFINYKGGMMTLAIGNPQIYREIYEQTFAIQNLENIEKTREVLKKYAHVNVRIGGWQTPFITLPKSHMENYIQRPLELGKMRK